MLRRGEAPSIRRVIVSAPARVHFGILDPFGVAGTRKYMSLGLGIQEPRTVVEVGWDLDQNIPTDVEREVHDVINRMRAIYNLELSNVKIRVLSHAPRHVGLGSTTQIKLATAYALSRLAGLSPDIPELARALGRGEVSGVGTYVFAHGGLVLDSGRRRDSDFPRLLLRLDFPMNWHIVVVVPPGRGPSETEEHKLFSHIASRPELVHYAHYVVLSRVIPSVQEGDFEEFTSGLEELQVTVGKMFSLAQGGVFSRISVDYVMLLRRMGLRGVGQSSWGPAVYGFSESRRHAESVCIEVEKRGARCIVTNADNCGSRTYYVRSTD